MSRRENENLPCPETDNIRQVCNKIERTSLKFMSYLHKIFQMVSTSFRVVAWVDARVGIRVDART